MHAEIRAALTLLSLVACVHSRSLTTQGNNWRTGHKKHKHSTDVAWDTTVRKREHIFKSLPDECCPSVTEIFQPLGGVSKTGKLLELYRDQNSTQSFYQTSCKDGVKGNTCKYIQRNRHLHSMCVQRYTYSYALVREFNSNRPWRMDYIRIRSGCSCEVRIPVRDDYYNKRKKDSFEVTI